MRQAFPGQEKRYEGDGLYSYNYYEGMSLRDYFAGQALISRHLHPSENVNIKDVVSWCYKVADAMIEQNKD